MGPMMLPEAPHKRRWGWLVLWTLLVFGGGVAAGPMLTAKTLALFGRASPTSGMSAPKLVTKDKPAALAPSIVPLPAVPRGGEEAPTRKERAKAPAAAAEPVAPQAAEPAEPEKPAGAAEPQPAAGPEAAPAPGGTETEAVVISVGRPSHTKSGTKAPSARSAPTKTASSKDIPEPEAAGPDDSVAERSSESKAAASSRKSKPSFDEPTEKDEPAAKPAAKSGDWLDGLMADVVTDKKGKEKQHQNKSLDAMLKDVQKSKPEPPPPEREEAAPPPPLSQADISRVMAGVKTRSKDCARQFGQKGIAELKLVVNKDGRVTDVTVGGKLASMPVAACIEKVVRAASFPRSAGLRFNYGIDVR